MTKGISLVEVLASILILGISLAVMYEMLYQGAISWEYGQNESEVVQNARVALERMAGEIRQAKKIYNDAGYNYTNLNRIEFWYDLNMDGNDTDTGGPGDDSGERISFRVDTNNNLLRETFVPANRALINSDILANFIKSFELEYRLADNTVVNPPSHGQNNIAIINLPCR